MVEPELCERLTAHFSVVEPYRMMRTDGSAEKSSRPIVHVSRAGVNINATRFENARAKVAEGTITEVYALFSGTIRTPPSDSKVRNCSPGGWMFRDSRVGIGPHILSY
jgi:hypothetical protein